LSCGQLVPRVPRRDYAATAALKYVIRVNSESKRSIPPFPSSASRQA
jgi:hypothetical protein